MEFNKHVQCRRVYLKSTCSRSHINSHIYVAEICVNGPHILVVKFNTIIIWSQISILWFCSIVCHFEQLWTFIQVNQSQDHVMTLIQSETSLLRSALGQGKCHLRNNVPLVDNLNISA